MNQLKILDKMTNQYNHFSSYSIDRLESEFSIHIKEVVEAFNNVLKVGSDDKLV